MHRDRVRSEREEDDDLASRERRYWEWASRACGVGRFLGMDKSESREGLQGVHGTGVENRERSKDSWIVQGRTLRLEQNCGEEKMNDGEGTVQGQWKWRE